MIWLMTTNGYPFRISDMDEERVRRHRWRAEISKTSGKPYVRCTIKREGVSATVYLHRMITGCPGTMKVDHRDNETLHNDRPNLRIATHNQNNFNRTGWSAGGFKGVSLDRTRWRARITLDGIVSNLGSFRKKEEAAKAYDAAAHRLYGEFAWLNFPEDYPLPLSDTPF